MQCNGRRRVSSRTSTGGSGVDTHINHLIDEMLLDGVKCCEHILATAILCECTIQYTGFELGPERLKGRLYIIMIY